MKKLILFMVLSFCLVFSASAWNPMVVTGGGGDTTFSCTGYSPCQNFEGAGYDNGETWTETVGDGTIDEDYSASPIIGLQSLRMTDGGVDSEVKVTFTTHTDNTETWVYFRMKVLTDLTTNNVILEVSDDEGGGFTLEVLTSGVLRMAHGAGTCNGATDVSGGGVFHIWLRWLSEVGTQIDGEYDLYVETTGTKGAVECGGTNGTANKSGINTAIFIAGGEAIDWVIDRVLIKNGTIGDQ